MDDVLIYLDEFIKLLYRRTPLVGTDIDNLWSPSLDSHHHSAIFWAKSMLCEHSSLQDICDFHHGQPF